MCKCRTLHFSAYMYLTLIKCRLSLKYVFSLADTYYLKQLFSVNFKGSLIQLESEYNGNNFIFYFREEIGLLINYL